MTPHFDNGQTTIHAGDCREHMAAMEPNSIDAIVCDPPYGLEFMGKEWDNIGRRQNHPLDPSKQIAHDTSTKPRAKNNPWQKERSGYGAPKKNPRCRKCGRLRFSSEASKCVCADPDLDFRTREYAQVMQDWHHAWAVAAYRVLKPGGRLLAFGGTRTSHRMVCAIEDAGFVIEDSIAWLYGSGFPKHKSKLKPAHEPIVVAWKPDTRATPLNIDSCRIVTTDRPTAIIDAWEQEPYLCSLCADRAASNAKPGTPETGASTARSPAAPTSSATAQSSPRATFKMGTGCSDGPNPAERSGDPFDVSSSSTGGYGNSTTVPSLTDTSSTTSTTIPSTTASKTCNSCGDPITHPTTTRESRSGEASAETRYTGRGGTDFAPLPGHRGGDPTGRWPSNVVLDEPAAALLDAQSGERPSRPNAYGKTEQRSEAVGYGVAAWNKSGPNYADTGGASRFYLNVAPDPLEGERFFYAAKASRRERSAGLPNGQQSTHPTVKPITLMAWLVKLVTPPGGTVYDPFMGSGTTGCAAALVGVRFVGSEMDPEYCEIARRRIAHWAEHGADGLKMAAPAAMGGLRRYGNGKGMGDTVRRCPEHGESFPSGSNHYRCGCPAVRVPPIDVSKPPPAVTDLPLFAAVAD